jgi:DNA polymerase
VLDDALAAAGIDRTRAYVTNAVKHFRWEARGKQRIHKKPARGHINACRPWLDGELAIVRPTVVVCLGAVAAQALIAPDFKVTQRRGEVIGSSPAIVATVHPSSILRGPPADRDRNLAAMVADLEVAAALLA